MHRRQQRTVFHPSQLLCGDREEEHGNEVIITGTVLLSSVYGR